MRTFDVAIVGAGPAGCAAAISIGDFAPELSLCLVGPELFVAEVPDGHQSEAQARIGESVPPQIEPILAHLGLSASFAADGHLPSYRTASAWGSEALIANEFFFQPQQLGWRLDRARFDRMMLAAASTHIAARVTAWAAGLSRRGEGWSLALDDGLRIAARFIVDATGRSATLARAIGLRSVTLDKLVGCSIQVADEAGDGGELLIETFADGWWYTAGLPGGRRIVM